MQESCKVLLLAAKVLSTTRHTTQNNNSLTGRHTPFEESNLCEADKLLKKSNEMALSQGFLQCCREVLLRCL